MSFDEAEAMLANRRDGSFLVRDSSDERYILSLSFRSLGGTHHTRIEHYKGINDMHFALQLHKQMYCNSVTLHVSGWCSGMAVNRHRAVAIKP